MPDIKKLNFRPLPGLSSKYLQMILSAYSWRGKEPLSQTQFVDLGNGDSAACEISTPPSWNQTDQTIAMIHGLGGSHRSTYLVRIARKLYNKGYKVVRINLRGCGSGKGKSKLPYSAGNSNDVLTVIQALKKQDPLSDITLIGFSLGGNIVLKLAGEIGGEAKKLLKTIIAICPSIDLAHSTGLIQERRHRLFHRYYLNKILEQDALLKAKNIQSIYELDELITGPAWGFKGADEYYQKCSSKPLLANIQQETHILFAEDDPFVSMDVLKNLPISDHVHLWSTKHGGHMGFIGFTNSYSLNWLDQLLIHWIEGDFTSELEKG